MNIDIETINILNENRIRTDAVSRCFDPISGMGSLGERFETNIPGKRKKVWLPASMWGLKLTVANYEELRCIHDFPYWAAKYVKVKRKGGGDDVAFILNRAQRKFVSVLEKQRLEGNPVRIILLKARQWGGSTCAQLYMAWLQLVHSCGLNSLIIAHQKTASDEIKDMYDRMMASYTLFDKKNRKLENVGRTGAIFRVPTRNCKVKIGTAERPNSCRGGDYNLVHCSEVGIWKLTDGKSPEDIVRSACSGILYTPNTIIIYESTANGTGNFFHREYEAAKRGVSQFSPLFVSWFDIDQYSLPFASDSELRDFAGSLIKFRFKENADSEREQPGAYLWWLWQQGATLEAINWYVKERAKYSEHGLMAAEYPSDDVEAFVHSGSRVFDKYRVEALRSGCALEPLRGEIDHCGFHPIPSGAWMIWKEADNSFSNCDSRYVAVVDIGGRSDKSDWSVIAVFDRQPMVYGCRPEIVAQWRGHVDFDRLAGIAAGAASYYDTALLVIESNTLDSHELDRCYTGDNSPSLLNRLRETYPNLYARRGSDENVIQGAPVKFGFHTNARTKPMIISSLVEAIRDSLYIERDSRCLDEFLTYEQRQNGSYGAIAGCHDDMLMTRAIGLHIILHELDIPYLSKTSGSHISRRNFRSGSYAAW